ncbi:hypothetical protein ACFQS6_04580 [Xanthomonas populi]|nr:hypothetical protein [Xanthomonas populi]
MPATSLATWLYREIDLGEQASIAGMLDRLVSDFRISSEEFDALFVREYDFSAQFAEVPIDISDIEGLIGTPPGVVPTKGVSLHELKIQGLGPIMDC